MSYTKRTGEVDAADSMPEGPGVIPAERKRIVDRSFCL
jgi:hypothetical protein